MIYGRRLVIKHWSSAAHYKTKLICDHLHVHEEMLSVALYVNIQNHNPRAGNTDTIMIRVSQLSIPTRIALARRGKYNLLGFTPFHKAIGPMESQALSQCRPV